MRRAMLSIAFAGVCKISCFSLDAAAPFGETATRNEEKYQRRN